MMDPYTPVHWTNEADKKLFYYNQTPTILLDIPALTLNCLPAQLGCGKAQALVSLPQQPNEGKSQQYHPGFADDLTEQIVETAKRQI